MRLYTIDWHSGEGTGVLLRALLMGGHRLGGLAFDGMGFHWRVGRLHFTITTVEANTSVSLPSLTNCMIIIQASFWLQV